MLCLLAFEKCREKLHIKTRSGTRFVLVADPTRKIKRNRAKIYGHDVLVALKKIWTILDYPCSLRLTAMLPKIIPKLEQHGSCLLKTPQEKNSFTSAEAL